MAKLQDGYAKIANKLIECLYSADLTLMQKEIILLVMRYTYGFNRKQARLSLSYIAKGIGRKRDKVCDSITALANKRILIKSESGGTTVLEVNNHTEEWDVCFRFGSPSQGTSASPSQGTRVVPARGLDASPSQGTKETQEDTKERKEKQTHKGATRRGVIDSPLFFELWEQYPKAKRDEAGRRFVTAEAVADIEGNEAAVRSALRVYLEGVKEEKYLQKASDFFRGNWKQYAPEEEETENNQKGLFQ